MNFTAAFVTFLAVSFVSLSRAEPPADFSLRSATSDSGFHLKEAQGKYVVLHFLLKTECPVCLRYTQDYAARSATLPNVMQVFVKPDTDKEIEAWSKKLTAEEAKELPIYRDPDAKLAKAFGIPDGYAFHGEVVHYPATVLLGPDGKEVFRYVGKNNRDRLSFDQLAAKLKELAAR